MNNQIPIFLYFGGEILYDTPEGVGYGNTRPKSIWINRSIKKEELERRIYEITGWNKEECAIKIQARYLIGRGNPRYFMLVPVDDDSCLASLIESTQSPDAVWGGLELYLERDIFTADRADTMQSIIGTNVGSNIVIPTASSNVMLHSIPETSTFPEVAVEFETQDEEDPVTHDDDFLLRNECAMNIVANENLSQLFVDAVVNNDLRAELETQEDINDALLNENEKDPGPVRSMSFQTAPAPEFESTDWVANAVVDNWAIQSVDTVDGVELYKGKRFEKKKDLIHAVKMYSIKQHRQYIVTKSGKDIFSARCKEETQHCKWSIRASIPKNSTYFQIKTLKEPHTCVNPILNCDHSQIDSKYVASMIVDIVKKQLGLTPAAIIEIVKQKCNYVISYKKAWSAKQKAIEMLFGGFTKSYQALPAFMDALQASNPGTVVHWHRDPLTSDGRIETFKKVFWAFHGSIEGFKYCRPVISIDGTFLYGKYKGVLLIAVAPDANDQLFPLAFALVENESNESWSWFMACIRQFVTQRVGLCVVSDRHMGILHTMDHPYLGWADPNAFHRFCMRHFATNFNTKFGDRNLMNKLKRIATQNQIRKFNKGMQDIEKVKPEAAAWIKKFPFEKWALSYDKGYRYGMMTTNLSEIFNSVLKGVRNLPVTAIVEFTFYRLNAYFTKRREIAEMHVLEGMSFAANIQRKLDLRRDKANCHEVTMFDHNLGVFQIRTGIRNHNGRQKGGKIQVVNIMERTCTCQKLQLYHYPCSHLMAACAARALDYIPFVDAYYSITSLANTWEPKFHPIPDKGYWPIYEGPIVLPDDSTKRCKKGRPKSSRIRNDMDVRMNVKEAGSCSICKQSGHNKRRCPRRNEAGGSSQ